MERAGLVGRVAEQGMLAAAVEAAAIGSPSAVVLHGEPGIGKTRLVDDAVGGLGQSAGVLWARCLRFSSDGAAFLPIGRAVSGWLGTADPDTRTAVLAGAQDLAAILPEVGSAPAGVTGGRLISLLATVFDRVSALHPLVLAVDDLQWADSSSLDLLAHLIAGFHPGQRLVLLGTYRDTELGPGHRLHEWVADMRRMPRVTVRPLQRLDRVETAALVRRIRDGVTGALGGGPPPDPDEVFERSQGNPYLAELIAGGNEVGSVSLAEALLGTWHRLGDRARALTQVLAVGGGPVPLPVLARIVPDAEPATGTLGDAVTEARAAGIAVVDGGAVWFRHPLLAEVIAATVDIVTAARIHDDYVAVLESAPGLNELLRAGLLALHHEQAGRSTQAFVASLRAADEAASVHATAEESAHLQRACRLWPAVEQAARGEAGDRASLLERACLAANRAGHLAACVVLAHETMSAVDVEKEPLRASRLLLRLPLHLDDPRAAAPAVMADRRRAMELALPFGDTDELASATAALAHSEFWSGISTGQARAEQAVGLAERAGSQVTAAWAQLVHSQFCWSSREGLAEADTAWHQLRAHGDVMDWALRSVLLLNCLEVVGDVDGMITLGRTVLEAATAAGAPVMGANIATRSAAQLIRRGRYGEAEAVLRQILAQRQVNDTTAAARAEAAILACRRGDLHAAGEHVARIRELWVGRGPLGNDIGDALLEYVWLRGDPSGAVDTVITDIPILMHLDMYKADERLVWGARAAADLAELGPDRARSRHEARTLLSRIEQTRGDSPARFTAVAPGDTVRPAFAACYAAERSRCLDAADQADRWTDAQRACEAASYPWETSWAAYQLGRALLRQRGRRGEAAQGLREAHRIAQELGARPLLGRIATIATQARIAVGSTQGQAHRAVDGAPEAELASVDLTAREREILAHVVQGQTYAEIATVLFISEKTVSVHVSHLLAKTGTRSRIELAALATRRDTARQ